MNLKLRVKSVSTRQSRIIRDRGSRPDVRGAKVPPPPGLQLARAQVSGGRDRSEALERPMYLATLVFNKSNRDDGSLSTRNKNRVPTTDPHKSRWIEDLIVYVKVPSNYASGHLSRENPNDNL